MDPIRLRIADPRPAFSDRIPGDMWRWPPGDIPGRMCWWIVLPPNHPDCGTPGHPGELSWRTTQRASDGQFWQVAGTAPLLTVTPSIDVVRYVPNPDFRLGNGQPSHIRQGSYWHGYITDGYLVTV